LKEETTAQQASRLASMLPSDWQPLFDQIPHLRDAVQQDWKVKSTVLHEFVSLCYHLNLVQVFDWPDWSEGKQWLNNPDTDYTSFDRLTLCQLLTTLIRADRFVEGTLFGALYDGRRRLIRLLEALQQEVGPSQISPHY
jgi:hypothetical protein